MNLPKTLIKIANELVSQNAKAILVGGAVRDFLLHKELKDYDVEVYGLKSIEQLEQLLSKFGSVNLVGKSFGILKLRVGNIEYDFSFPRKEQKSGVGHRGFDVEIDGSLSFDEASKRRDFTINAMGYDIVENKILDPFGGQRCLDCKILKHIDDKTFIEDPLRVYRAIQFSARFELELHESTFKLCEEMVERGDLDDLSRERVYEEFKKLLLKSKKPSIGFNLMRELGILKYFPELEGLIGIPQSPIWHPEGDVWIHTMLAVDKMALELTKDEYKELCERDRLKYMFAILCHDFGKPSCTKFKDDGKITSIGHEEAGVEPTKSFLNRLTNDTKLINSILPLVEYHLRPSIYYQNNANASTIRRLATKVNIEDLVLVAKADKLGRTSESALSGEYPAGEWLLQRAKELSVDKKPAEPILLGRDLIALGFNPPPKFKDILENIYQEQIEGNVNTKNEAIELVKAHFL